MGIIGPNGIGKTTFAKLLAGKEQPTEGISPLEMEENLLEIKQDEDDDDVPEEDIDRPKRKITISYKPQYITITSSLTVKDLLEKVNPNILRDSWYRTELINPLNIENLLDQKVNTLSGGELQKVAIIECMARDADIYLLDEPSAYISSEERMVVAKSIRKIVKSNKKAALIIAHDLMMLAYIADKIQVFEGIPAVQGIARTPTNVQNGFNRFLATMDITFRKDPRTGRPRVNKKDSKLDKAQKAKKQYYYVN